MEDFITKPPRGARKARKRVGRGSGSGHGGTSGKGNKGQNARSGGGVRIGFEGGQMPLFRKVPRRGFSNAEFRKRYAVVNIGLLEKHFASEDQVTPERLVEVGLVRDLALPVKLLGTGDLTRKLVVKIHRISESARAKVEAAGGTVVIESPGGGAPKDEKGPARG
jgi:large subunit ribosomal protein L15